MMKHHLFTGCMLLLVANRVCPAEAQQATGNQQVAQQEQRAPLRRTSQRLPVQQANWSGTQVGGFGGGSVMPINFVEPGANQFFRGAPGGPPVLLGFGPLTSPLSDPETPFSFSGNRVSPTLGLFLGYNKQYGSVVYGVEVEVAWKKGNTSRTLVTMQDAVYLSGNTAERTENFTGSIGQKWDLSLRPRVGFLVTPVMLLYATGGLAFGELTGSFSYSAHTLYCTNTLPCPPAEVFGIDTTTGAARWQDIRLGGTGGAGIERQIALNLKARIEYRYTDFGSFSKDVALARSTTVVPPFGSPNTGSTNAHLEMRAAFHTVRFGLGMNF
jgi:outer membrane immunogenic protein